MKTVDGDYRNEPQVTVEEVQRLEYERDQARAERDRLRDEAEEVRVERDHLVKRMRSIATAEERGFGMAYVRGAALAALADVEGDEDG